MEPRKHPGFNVTVTQPAETYFDIAPTPRTRATEDRREIEVTVTAVGAGDHHDLTPQLGGDIVVPTEDKELAELVISDGLTVGQREAVLDVAEFYLTSTSWDVGEETDWECRNQRAYFLNEYPYGWPTYYYLPNLLANLHHEPDRKWIDGLIEYLAVDGSAAAPKLAGLLGKALELNLGMELYSGLLCDEIEKYELLYLRFRQQIFIMYADDTKRRQRAILGLPEPQPGVEYQRPAAHSPEARTVTEAISADVEVKTLQLQALQRKVLHDLAEVKRSVVLDMLERKTFAFPTPSVFLPDDEKRKENERAADAVAAKFRAAAQAAKNGGTLSAPDLLRQMAGLIGQATTQVATNVGLDFLLKTYESSMIKALNDLEEVGGNERAAVQKTRDSIRMTIQIGANNYAAAVTKYIEKFQGLGWQSLKFDNLWIKPSPTGYRGINSQWWFVLSEDEIKELSEKDRLAFGALVFAKPVFAEIQFHTPDSFYIKQEATHEIYDELKRVNTGTASETPTEKSERLAKKSKLIKQLTDVQNQLADVTPPGVLEIVPPVREEPPVDYNF
ncbi:hypothetical protein [Kitasatospora mediocidica]|uniref:hypothetical protein n=1 Tax=Kitasatospora mediocidica TaxID=58352 RepID=UPI0005684E89|nr:hypothetical protein [Kitasatospora mediocidica]